MTTILLVSLLIGMRHALESDHLAAVASLATRSPGLCQTLLLGTIWGIGHTLALLLFGSVVVWLGSTVPRALAEGLELIVAIMLLALGTEVLLRLHRRRNRPSAGDSGDLPPHAPLHRLTLRALLVGVVHGMAGTSALLLLALPAIETPWEAMVYILTFGLGSILGMAALSAMIALPLSRRPTSRQDALQIAVGLFTLGSGFRIAWNLLAC